MRASAWKSSVGKARAAAKGDGRSPQAGSRSRKPEPKLVHARRAAEGRRGARRPDRALGYEVTAADVRKRLAGLAQEPASTSLVAAAILASKKLGRLLHAPPDAARFSG